MDKVSKSEFATIMVMIANAYNGRFVIIDEDSKERKSEITSTWYQFFDEYSADTVKYVAMEWIKHNRIPPTIADLLNGCKEKRKTDRILSPEKIVDMTDEEWMEMMGVTKEDEV